jgi:hypothetical protein
MDPKTQERYETGKKEEYIAAMDGFHRGYETEETSTRRPAAGAEKLEAGWMKHCSGAAVVEGEHCGAGAAA